MLFVPEQSAGQSNTSLSGVVCDELTGKAIVAATVFLSGTAYSATTDGDGRFYFEHIPEGWYRATISSTGYDTTVTSVFQISSEVWSFHKLPLTPQPKVVPGIVVRGVITPARIGSVEVIERELIDTRQPADLSELLATVPGVNVQEDGTSAKVSIRGSASRHVLILVDGQSINSSATGEVDLRSIPIEMVNRVEIHRGGASAEFGPGASGGAINIITVLDNPGLKRQLSLERSTGSWGTGISTLSAVSPLAVRKLSTSINFSRRTSTGDFPFRYSAEPSPVIYEGTRINNVVTTTNLHMAANYHPRTDSDIRLSLQNYNSHRGLPGKARSQNEYAEADDDRLLINSTWKQTFSLRLQTEMRAGYSRYKQHFVDTKSSANQVHSEYVNDIFSLGMDCRWLPFEGQTVKIRTDLRDERLDHENILKPSTGMGHTGRKDAGFSATSIQHVDLPDWAGFECLTLESALRWDRVSTHRNPVSATDTSSKQIIKFLSPKFGASLTVGENLSLMIRGSYGKSMTLPTLNALFWKADARSVGNPDLKPEKTEHSEATVETSGDFGHVVLSGSVTYFHTCYSDMVKWYPDFRGVWKPSNLAHAQVTGHEDIITADLFDGLLNITYQNTITTALNRVPGHNTYGNQLTFTPYYRTDLRFEIHIPWALASYAIHRVDRRYAKENNQKWYPAYRLDDLHLGAWFEWNKWRIRADYKVHNLRDEDYTLITHYPMPPRGWQFGVTLVYDTETGH